VEFASRFAVVPNELRDLLLERDDFQQIPRSVRNDQQALTIASDLGYTTRALA
jgi:hypothetical protein